MSSQNYSAELLKMEGGRIENLEETADEIVLQISLERQTQRCGAATNHIHNYRIQQVRDLELRRKALRLLSRQRRYVCPACRKQFPEANCALPIAPVRKSWHCCASAAA